MYTNERIIMSIDNTIYALSNINAIMGSALGYSRAKQNGVDSASALTDFGLNVASGAIRNEAARDIQRNSGSYIGYAINSAAGYGDLESNSRAINGLIGASILTSPFGIFGNPFMTSALYGCGPYGGGFWNSGFFGGGCGCGNRFMFGAPSMFGMNGFWC